eukprot:1159652-Pelagomonas_calceolata.AAC.24
MYIQLLFPKPPSPLNPVIWAKAITWLEKVSGVMKSDAAHQQALLPHLRHCSWSVALNGSNLVRWQH